MKTSLTPESIRPITKRLEDANNAFAKRYPGESGKRQPVHTVYGGAHLFRAEAAPKLGGLALKSLEQYAPDFVSFARALHMPGWERLPMQPAEAHALAKWCEANGAAARVANYPAWLAHACSTQRA